MSDLGRLAITLPAPFFDARECVELARRAEQEWGFEAIWLAETNGPDSFSLAGAVAGATSRVTIGTGIVPVYNRSPAVLAMSAFVLGDTIAASMDNSADVIQQAGCSNNGQGTGLGGGNGGGNGNGAGNGNGNSC